jgi:N-acetylglucosaminyldiphosphoundecaprenol N-acetyl-beta-D-mannosaminyltransferase
MNSSYSCLPYVENPLPPVPSFGCDGSESYGERSALAPWVEACRSEIWGIPFHSLTMQETVNAMDRWVERRVPGYAITANLNYAMLCDRDPKLAELTRKAAFVLCDGMPIYWRSRWNKVKLPERVAGSDLIYRLAERCAERGYRVYFYGAAEGIAKKTAERLVELYPRLQVAGWQSPPFGATTQDQIQQSLDHIRRAKPDILLAALGQPKGEYWVQQYFELLDIPLSMQVGATFDFVAGVCKRAPRFFQKTGLEWLHRACSDPVRLVPRYTKNILFLIKALRKDGIDALSDHSLGAPTKITS